MSTDMDGPGTVAVVIVNWNSGEMLFRAVAALGRQDHPCRVFIVDNASTDSSVDDVLHRFPAVEVIRAGGNLGFAAGNNLAVRRLSAYEWIAFLNPDAFPEPDWLRRLVSAAAARPDYASFASCVVFDSDPGILDAAGDDFHVSGFAWRRGHGRRAGSQSADREVFMATATAALYRRSAFEEAGGFDERYFCYYEDVDLGVRLRLLGHRCWYVAGAIVRHVGSGITGKGSAFVAKHTQRNRIWTFVKVMPSPWLWLLLPLHTFYQLVALLHYARQGQMAPALRGTLEALRGLGPVLRARRIVQHSRRVNSREFFRTMRGGLFAPLMRSQADPD